MNTRKNHGNTQISADFYGVDNSLYEDLRETSKVKEQGDEKGVPKITKLYPGGATGKEHTCQCRRPKRCGFNPWVGNIPWRGNGNPLQYSCLENPRDRGDWRATVHGVAKSQTRLKQLSTLSTRSPSLYSKMGPLKSQNLNFLNCKDAQVLTWVNGFIYRVRESQNLKNLRDYKVNYIAFFLQEGTEDRRDCEDTIGSVYWHTFFSACIILPSGLGCLTNTHSSSRLGSNITYSNGLGVLLHAHKMLNVFLYHSLDKVLRTYCVSGTVLGIWDTSVIQNPLACV